MPFNQLTRCFASFKSFLREEMCRVKLRGNGVVSQENWFCLFKVSTDYKCGKKWQQAFVQTG
jgi:hypothetical protein